jgi:hypothetical protein
MVDEPEEGRLMSEKEKLIELAVKHWGKTPQLLKTIEELSGLSRAISRFLIIQNDERKAYDAHHWNTDLQEMEILHEIVDVEIMIAQILESLKKPSAYRMAWDVKLANLKRLLKYEEVSEG